MLQFKQSFRSSPLNPWEGSGIPHSIYSRLVKTNKRPLIFSALSRVLKLKDNLDRKPECIPSLKMRFFSL